MKNHLKFAAALVLSVPGACSTTGVTTQSQQDPSLYSYRDFSKYHAGRDTRVEIIGDKLGAAPAAFDEAVTKAMYGANSGIPARFTTQPGPSEEKNLKVVMAFNTATRYDLCKAPAPEIRATGPKTYLQAAWCWDDRTLSYVQSWAPTTVKPGDPGFRDMVSAAVRDLFPQFIDNKLRENEDNNRRIP